MKREDLMHERDSTRIQISLAKDRGEGTAALQAKLREIEGMLAALNGVEPKQFAASRKRRQNRTYDPVEKPE
jgi:hypothetical protein